MDKDKTKKKPIKKLADAAKNVSDHTAEIVKRNGEEGTPSSSQAELEKRLGRFLALQWAYTNILNMMSLTDMLPKIAEAVVNILEYAHAFVIIFDSDRNIEPIVAFHSKRGMELEKDVEKSVIQTLKAALVKEQSELADIELTDVQEKQEFEPPPPSEYNGIQEILGAKNMISVPLTARDRPLGNILAFTHRDDILETEEQPLWILASQAAITIDNVRLYDEALVNTQKLRESHEMSQITMENAIAGASIVQDAKFQYVNPIFEEMLGYTSQDLIGKPTADFIHPDDRERIIQEVIASLKGNLRSLHEFRLLKRNGDVVWVLEKVVSIKWKAKRAILAIALDVTELKNAGEALRESEEKMKIVFDALKDGIVVTDLKINMIQVNEAARRLAGYPTKEDMIGKNALDFITAEDIEKAMQPMNEAVQGRPIDWGDFKLRSKTGELFDAQVGVNMLHDVNGNLDGFVTIIHDITERKRMESQIRTSEEKLRFMFESIGDGIVVTDLSGKAVEENLAAARMFGFESKEEVVGMDGLAFIAEKNREAAKLSLLEAMEKGSGITKEFTLIDKNRNEFEGEISAAISRDSAGNPTGFICVIRDITARKKMDQAKSDFVALVSHQLKTPVAGIRGYVENMLDGLTGELNEKQKRYLSDMRVLCLRNYRLISDLLNTSMIERGMLSIDLGPTKLSDIANTVIKDYYGKIEEKGLALKAEGMNGQDIVVLADRDKSVEALANIVNNCTKFTDQGSITIKVSHDNEYGIVEVRDTGRGMSNEILEELFKRQKILSGGPVAGGGAGLGLYIAKGFMQAQKGDITATSVMGKGSSFILKIPLYKEQ
ncbi:MAG: PAS domain S-box protein [Dehalococcoidia bacterium]|jgi:signal transduction histidine kinase